MSASLFLYLGQLAYLLTFVSFAVRNVLWLRLVAVAASFVAIAYSLGVPGGPFWIPVLWNALFLLVNCTHLLLNRWRQRSVALDPLENFLSKTALANFPPAEVKSFAKAAGEGKLPAGNHLIRSGTNISHLFCLPKGRADVLTSGRKCAELGPGCFVGEMSLLTRSATRADVIAATELSLLVWPHEEIEKWVNADAARLGLLQTALGAQVVDQLLRQNEQLLEEARERTAV
jgi:CRP-like cAMP-binding protein